MNRARINSPSAIMGLTDSVNVNEDQRAVVYPTILANFYSQAVLGHPRLIHNGFANTWYYDGHAKAVDIEGIGDYVTAAGRKTPNSGVYAQDENMQVISTKTK